MRPLEFIHTFENFSAGNIASRAHAWLKITTDPWIENTVKGLKITFVRELFQTRTPYPYKIVDEEKLAIDTQIDRFLDKGIIVPTKREQGEFISNIFSRPKPDGSVRIILDLSKLNDEVEKLHFKMNSLQTALDMIRPQCYMASVDLRDAYYSVKIHEQDQKLLKFWWRDKLFQFVGMPNGLTSAPRTFTKLLTPVFAHLRQQGHECFPYIDDTFVIADTMDGTRKSARALAKTLDELGFVIHLKKSVLTPTQKLVFLGFEINSVQMTVKPTGEKVAKFMRAVHDLKQKLRPTIRQVAGLIGLMVAYLPAVKYGGAYIKGLEIDKNLALKRQRGNFDAKMSISQEAWVDINWWVINLPLASRAIEAAHPEITIYTDASLQGWGAYTEHIGEAPIITGGKWKPEEAGNHINVLELKAIHHGLRSLVPKDKTHIKVMTDNTTALSYIKNMGGAHSQECNGEAKKIWQFCEQNNMWLYPAHIPGVLNVEADKASRKFSDDIEWELAPRLWNKLVNKWGEPTVDMFASRINNKCKKFVSWYPQPEAWQVDAFTMSWDLPNEFLYFFPPFSLAGRVLRNITTYRCKAILITPDWQSQPWVSMATKRATTYMRFRKAKNNLIPHGTPNNPQQFTTTPMMAFLFSGSN